MWCSSVSLSVWANAWLAGQAAPDDVLDALTAWAPVHSVVAYDAVSAGRTGLPWPGPQDAAGPMSLLQTVRSANGQIRVVLPVPGDVRGLPAGTDFARQALEAEEAVLIDGAHPIGLVPMLDETGEIATWTAHVLPDVPPAQQYDLGAAEYALRSAVRDAAEALRRVGTQYTGRDDPRDVVEDLVDAAKLHRIPAHAPARAVRVLENATLVDAILTVGAPTALSTAQSSSQLQHSAAALDPLAAVVRTARLAAVDAILHSTRRG